jgi:hypothetical protein
MSAETWLTADEAILQGFATQVVKRELPEVAEQVARACQSPMLRLYRNTPEHLKALGSGSAQRSNAKLLGPEQIRARMATAIGGRRFEHHA